MPLIRTTGALPLKIVQGHSPSCPSDKFHVNWSSVCRGICLPK